MTDVFTCRQLTWCHPGAGNVMRWAIDGHPDGDHRSFCGDFPNEATARETARRWNETGGDAVRIHWIKATSDLDSDRGTYVITIEGVRWRKACCGWHGMEEAATAAAVIRDLIAKHGLVAAREFAEAFR